LISRPRPHLVEKIRIADDEQAAPERVIAEGQRGIVESAHVDRSPQPP
jgi:hypothetical protein